MTKRGMGCLEGIKAEVHAAPDKPELARRVTTRLTDCLAPVGHSDDVVAAVADGDVETLDPRRKVPREGVFDASTDRPANVLTLVTRRIRNPLCAVEGPGRREGSSSRDVTVLVLKSRPGQTTGSVNQDTVIGDTQASTDCAEEVPLLGQVEECHIARVRAGWQ